MKQQWYNIRAVAGEAPEVMLYGEIGGFGISALDFINEVKSLKTKSLTLRVNSPGGSVFDGLSIYNFLRTLNVSVVIDGLAASMGSVVAMAGRRIKMARGAMMMIHNPWTQIGGDSAEMRRAAEFLDKTKKSLVATYASKTGKDESEIAAMMDAETWMDSEEAVELGFADETDDADAQDFSAFNLSAFKHPMGKKQPPSVDTNTEGEPMKKDDQAKQIEVELSQTTAALKTAEDSLKLKDESIAKLTADATALTAKCGELETALKAKTDEAVKSVESLQAVAVEVEQLKAKLVEAEASAGKKAQEALAAIGVPPVNTDVATAEPSAAQLKAEYEKLAKTNFAQARDFWKKHEAKLSTPQMLAWKKQNGLY